MFSKFVTNDVELSLQYFVPLSTRDGTIMTFLIIAITIIAGFGNRDDFTIIAIIAIIVHRDER